MATTYHGTYFPNRLFRPTVGRALCRRRAAGQCLPLTAEGIRPALYFGVECGAHHPADLRGPRGSQRLARALSCARGPLSPRYPDFTIAQWSSEHVRPTCSSPSRGSPQRYPCCRVWPRTVGSGASSRSVPGSGSARGVTESGSDQPHSWALAWPSPSACAAYLGWSSWDGRACYRSRTVVPRQPLHEEESWSNGGGGASHLHPGPALQVVLAPIPARCRHSRSLSSASGWGSSTR